MVIFECIAGRLAILFSEQLKLSRLIYDSKLVTLVSKFLSSETVLIFSGIYVFATPVNLLPSNLTSLRLLLFVVEKMKSSISLLFAVRLTKFGKLLAYRNPLSRGADVPTLTAVTFRISFFKLIFFICIN